jgi:hypothetical protein
VHTVGTHHQVIGLLAAIAHCDVHPSGVLREPGDMDTHLHVKAISKGSMELAAMNADGGCHALPEFLDVYFKQRPSPRGEVPATTDRSGGVQNPISDPEILEGSYRITRQVHSGALFPIGSPFDQRNVDSPARACPR